MDNSHLNFEIKRKLFHLCSIIFPIIYMFTPKVTMCIIMGLISAITVYLDVSKHHNEKIKGSIDRFFGNFLRSKEASGNNILTGSSYMALGLLITCAFFSKGLAITSWLVLTISDCAAAIVGMRFGIPLANGKSYIGSFVFFIFTFLISILSYFMIGYKTSFFIIIISSIITTMVEFFSEELKMNDNFSIPLSYALSTVILTYIL